MDSNITIALADDHVLLRNALASLINGFEGFRVSMQASTGKELLAELRKGKVPEIAILDLSMPEMDGYQTARWLRDNYAEVRVLMLTMYDSEPTLIRLLQAGVKGFLKKDIHPSELRFALHSVIQYGYYYSSHTTGKLANLFREKPRQNSALSRALLTEQEMQFLGLACSELTYKEIAQRMNLNPRSVDTLRDHLFNKLDVKSRVGLAIYSLKHGIVTY
jgi:two-component system, NarL family, invasion response regulator UvrY